MYKYFRTNTRLMRALISFWAMFTVLVIFAAYGKSAILASEAFHSFFDALIVSLSLYAIKKINKINSEYTYGMHRLEIIYSLLNILVVIIGTVIGTIISILFIVFDITDNPIIVVIASTIATIIGLIASTEEEKGQEIRKSVKLHAVLDVVSYIFGIVFGIIILFTGYHILDPISSLLVLGIIVAKNSSQIRGYVDVIMEKSPIDTKEIENTLKQVFPTVHHIHVWSICPHVKVATLHVSESPDIKLEEMDKKRKYIESVLLTKYGINHVTIQFETSKTE